MSSESPYSLTGKAGPNNSILVTLRGDSYEELLNNAAAAGLLAVQVGEFYAQAFGGDVTEARAIATVTPITQGLVPQSTVGAPLPQPQAAPAPAVPQALPPGYPGNCIHGVRQMKSIQTKSGRPWSFWECAKPWDKNEPKESYCEKITVK